MQGAHHCEGGLTEKIKREISNKGVGQLMCGEVLEKRRYYLSFIIRIIVFLVQNELALRGYGTARNNLKQPCSITYFSSLDKTTKG